MKTNFTSPLLHFSTVEGFKFNSFFASVSVKYRYTSSFTFFRFVIFLVLITIIPGCKGDDLIVHPVYIKEVLNDPSSIFGSGYDCYIDTAQCVESNCFCYNQSCCTREDLDPCNYDDMDEYADAVACELMKLVNGCIQKSFPLGCYFYNDTCVKNIATPPSLDSLIDNGRPFKYCSRSICGEHTCPLLGNDIEYLHLYMSVAYQDSLVNYIKRISNLFKPICPEGYSASVGNIYIKKCKTQELCNCTSGSSACCYDTELRLRIEYYCCPVF